MTLPFLQVRYAVALMVSVVVTIGLLRVSAAAADTVVASYGTPGTYALTIPQYTTSMTIAANGGSGTLGGRDGGQVNSAGLGGHGAVVTVTIPVVPGTFIAPGDPLQVAVGGQAGGGAGGSGNENAGGGGSGGAATVVTDQVQLVLAVAGGGGGGGGAGGAFVGLNGGNGGQGSGTAQNGFPGSGAGAGGGGASGQDLHCTAVGAGAAAFPADGGTDAGGGGGGGTGWCAGSAGASGGAGGGGGGGGGSGGSLFWGGGTGSVGIAADSGDGSAVITFTRSNVAPQFTSGAAATVPSTAKVALQVTASGFPAPTFALTGAPSWLTVNSTSGAISGTIPPRTLGRFTFGITASNGVAPNASQQFALSVTGPPFKLTAPGTLKGNVTNPFSATLAASGGVAPYSWSLVSGTLPPGLALSPAGVISGTPTATGTSTFTVKAIDSALPTAETSTEPVTMTVAPRTLTITTAAVAAAKVGTAYSQSLSAAMGTAPLHWSITGGALPAGLALNAATGAITGTPTTAGTTAATVKVTDATSPTAMVATASYNFVVRANIQAAVFVTNAANSSVRSFALGASGNAAPVSAITGSSTGLLGTSAVAIDATGRLYVASLANNTIAEFAYGANGNAVPSSTIVGSATGISYPDALAIDSGGRLYVADYNTQSITVYATGASGNATPVATIAGSNTGLHGPTALAFDPAGHLWVANYTANSLTEYTATASGNATPLATITGSATGLNGPEGMTLDAADHLLVSNAHADSLTEYSTTANGSVAPLRTISGTATGLNTPVGVDVDANGNIYVANENGGVTEYSASATGDPSPLATIAGALTGLAAPAGLAVAPPLSVRTAKLPATRVGRHYRVRLRAYLGTTPYRWTVRRGRLPHGLRLTRTGILTGRPRRAGTYRFTVRARDHTRPAMTATRRLALVVHPARRRHRTHPS